MLNDITKSFGILCLVALFGACATVKPGYEEPTVNLTSFRMVPSEGVAPQFEVGLQIINPNRDALELVGLAYTISLEGRDVISGVSNDLPVIEGYDQGEVKLLASTNLIEGARLIGNLMSEPRDSLNYEFRAKLDVGALSPAIRVEESGTLDLGNTQN